MSPFGTSRLFVAKLRNGEAPLTFHRPDVHQNTANPGLGAYWRTKKNPPA
jgi:hypothetical protein